MNTRDRVGVRAGFNLDLSGSCDFTRSDWNGKTTGLMRRRFGFSNNPAILLDKLFSVFAYYLDYSGTV